MKKISFVLFVIIVLIWNVVLTILLINNNVKTEQVVTEEKVYGISTDLTKVAQDCYSSVVGVKSSQGDQTGFIYKQNNDKAYIITTYHGIGSDSVVSVVFANSKSIPASVIGFDFKMDVAVLEIDSPYSLNVVKCGDNTFTKNGEFIICIGSSNKNDITNDIELGIISNSLVNIVDRVTYQSASYNINKEMLALSLNAFEGYSGSPIFNMKNETIGMIQMSDNKKIYSLTINELKVIVDKIMNNEEVNKVNLGIKGKYIKNMEEYERNMMNIPFEITNGYYVEDIESDSIARKIGILSSDIIISINNVSINNQKDLLSILYSNSNQDLLFSIYRGKEIIEIKGNIDD